MCAPVARVVAAQGTKAACAEDVILRSPALHTCLGATIRGGLGDALFDILPLVNEGDSLLRLGTLCRLFDGFLLRRGVP
jgi:hypothetical protein